MPKERNYNPVQAQRKADKAKEIKKGKAQQAARQNEKFAKRNPERIQKQIDDLKAIATSGGKLTSHEESTLQSLERDLKLVLKAREALGDKAPTFGRGGSRPDGQGQGVLGKRRRDQEHTSSDDDDVPEDVKNIPMPRDTPPPIPKAIMDEWYAKRRAKRANANDTPLGDNRGRPTQAVDGEQSAPSVPVAAQTVYEAKPIIRDLKKEAVSAFMPTVVRRKMDKSKGQGGLMEPEEADRLEQEGYLGTGSTTSTVPTSRPQTVTMEEVDDEEGSA